MAVRFPGGSQRVLLLSLAVLRVSGVAWDATVDPACCAYPEHDPRDYNYPYSHLLYAEVVPDVTGAFVAMTALRLTYAPDAVVSYGKWLAPEAVIHAPSVEFAVDPPSADELPPMHTLIAVDPDVPFRDRPDGRERCAPPARARTCRAAPQKCSNRLTRVI